MLNLVKEFLPTVILLELQIILSREVNILKLHSQSDKLRVHDWVIILKN